MTQRFLPHPGLTITIFVLWMLLASTLSVGNFALAAVIGIGLPQVLVRFWPDRRPILKPLTALRLFIVFLLDMVVANWVVARQVLGPTDRLQSSFVEVPLDEEDVFIAALLGSILALTPGTVSVDVDRERWALILHALHVDDEEALISRIKSRYERPLKEIFGC